jgi:hypothetical protein
MNEKTTTCHDCHDFHDFKWQNTNIYPILIAFLYDVTPFLTRLIVTTPKTNTHMTKSTMLEL